MQNNSQEWARAFARQAEADWITYQQMEAELPSKPACHRLLFLQMSCEKLVKSHLLLGGMDPESKDFRVHTWIKRRLREILRAYIANTFRSIDHERSVMKRFKLLAQEIEILNPAADDDKRRPENCEYPWFDGARVLSPLDYSFPAVDLLDQPNGIRFKKALKEAIEDQLRTTKNQ